MRRTEIDKRQDDLRVAGLALQLAVAWSAHDTFLDYDRDYDGAEAEKAVRFVRNLIEEASDQRIDGHDDDEEEETPIAAAAQSITIVIPEGDPLPERTVSMNREGLITWTMPAPQRAR